MPLRVISSTSETRLMQRMDFCAERFWKCLQRTAEASWLFQHLQQSLEPEAHVRQFLAGFAPGTLERYLANISTFLDFQLSEGNGTADVSLALMADCFYSAQRSAAQDRGLHRTSPLMCIKSLRWWAKHADWRDLHTALQSTLVSAYAKTTRSKDKKESYPIPLAVLAAWERMVCTAQCTQSQRLFLGTAMLCSHVSIRFGDIQRVGWSSLQLSTAGLHGACTATKTTRSGQPFACTWRGIKAATWLLHGFSIG